MPQAEIGDLIVELRSATAGVATYRRDFDHMAELTGRLADERQRGRQGGLRQALNASGAASAALAQRRPHVRPMEGEAMTGPRSAACDTKQ